MGGGVNTLASYVLYWVLLALLSPQGAYAISFVVGLILSYILNLRFVFRKRHSSSKMLMFLAVYLLVYVLGAGVLHVAIFYLGIPAGLAPLLSIICTLPVSFLLLRLLLADRTTSTKE